MRVICRTTDKSTVCAISGDAALKNVVKTVANESADFHEAQQVVM